VIKILEGFGFRVVHIKGSHHRMRFRAGDVTCTTTVPVHGSKSISTGTLASIFRQATRCIPEEALRVFFYTED
jgi:predicted RNA binding protein YcfA (HicA-like mRNA interferase family)